MSLIKNIKLVFGLKDGKIIHINELTKEERGLSCGCICPSCKTPLQAKMGSQKRHHFSHNSAKCSIDTAIQTAIHLLAKEIIAEKGILTFPEISLKYQDSEFFNSKYIKYVPESIEIKPKRTRKCDKIFIEKKLSSIVPDIIFVSGKHSCIIEIAVTHFVDEIKKTKIKELNLATIEIDLSKYYDKDFDRTEFENDIINNPENRKWIHYPNIENLIQKADLEYKKKTEAIKQKKLEKKREKQRQQELQKKQKENYYKSKLKQYRSDIKTNNAIKELRFQNAIKDNSFPFFLDIPIDNEIVFKCDRRIWQAALFDKFIYYRNTSDNATVSINNINQWIRKHQQLFRLNWDLINNDSVKTYYVIEQYLTYMHFLGFIEELKNQKAKILHAYTLTPPNLENSHLLYSAVKSVDIYSQTPNKEIEQHLRDCYDVFLSKKKALDYHMDYGYIKCCIK